MPALECLVYLSSATRLLSEAQLESLLEKVRPLNARDRITGVLLYADGNFLQYIEGPPADLERVFGRIRRDPLHRDVIEVYRAPIERRQFDGWLMGFARVPRSALLQLQQASWQGVSSAGFTGAPPALELLDSLWNDTMRAR